MIDLATAPPKYTPSLLAACTHGEIDVARLLLDEGCDVKLSKASGWNALMESVNQGYPNLVQVSQQAASHSITAHHMIAYGIPWHHIASHDTT